jgi:hypothetical protein
MKKFSMDKIINLFNDFNIASKHQLKISVPRYKSEIIRPIDLEFFQLAVEIFQSIIQVFKQ